MTTPSPDEREQLARLLFSRLSLHRIKDLYDTRYHSEGTRKIWREEADAILSAGFRLPGTPTPTHRCVNCNREWQETQLEVWQGFPVKQCCPECKSACAKMDPVPTTPTREHDLYKTGDADAPRVIQDGNGAVALGLCRRCGKAEVELSEPCVPTTPSEDEQRWAELAAATDKD